MAQKPGRVPVGSPRVITVINRDNPAQPTQKQKNDTCLLVPPNLVRSSVISKEQLQVPAKARREYQRGCSALIKKNNSAAEQHLRKAVQEYPKYATAWVTLGEVLTEENKSEDANDACSRAATVDPTNLPAQVCLARIAERTQKWSEELKHADRVLELDPNCILAYEYQAAAKANLGNLGEAETSALRAIDLDKSHQEPGLFFLLGRVYQLSGDDARAEEELRQYLRYTHNAERAVQARQILARLENGEHEDTRIPASKTASDTSGKLSRQWQPSDIDEASTSLPDDATCPLSQVLQEASQRMTELVDNLQRFSATEHVEHTEFRKNGKPRRSTSELFSYLAEIEQNPYHGFWVNEYRVAKGQTDPPPLADTGTAALALLFHPRVIGNVRVHCEGRVDLQGAPVWQLRFEEGPDKSKSFSALRIRDAEYRIRLKGRVWISADQYQVFRLETDLVEPIPEIRLEVEHFDVSYAPVGFANNKFHLWLPQSASMSIVYRGHHYQRLHNFSRFQLFLVDTEQHVKEPSSRQSRNPALAER